MRRDGRLPRVDGCRPAIHGQNKSSQTDYAKVICLVYGIDVETNKTKNSKTLSKTTEENET